MNIVAQMMATWNFYEIICLGLQIRYVAESSEGGMTQLIG